MQLKLATWQEVENYLQQSNGIIIPIGSCEQHGPNGLIGTDAICPETIAARVGEQTGALVAPTINFGMAQHHLGFPGSISLRPSTLIRVVADVVESLAVQGFRKFYFLNGHGGNEPSVTAAFSEIYAASSFGQTDRQLHCQLRNWWHLKSVAAYSKEHFGAAEGRHATPSEVALTYFAHPEAVKNVAMSPELAPLGDIRDAANYRKQFPDGRIGSNPALASVAHGEALLAGAVAEVVTDYRAFMAQD